MNEITEIWTRLEQWLVNNVLDQGFQEGATAQEIFDLEQHLGVTLPDDYKIFLSLCNGQVQPTRMSFYYGYLLSVSEIKQQSDSWKSIVDDDGTFFGETSTPDLGIQNSWWNPLWIPITQTGSGDHLCLDLAPATGGTVGQIIAIWHDDEYRQLVQPSFTEWLKQVLFGLESGHFTYQNDECDVIDPKDL